MVRASMRDRRPDVFCTTCAVALNARRLATKSAVSYLCVAAALQAGQWSFPVILARHSDVCGASLGKVASADFAIQTLPRL